MRAALLALACAAGLVAACSGGDPRLSYPRTAEARATVAARPAPTAVPLVQASRPDLDEDEEPLDVTALQLPQPDDTEPEPVK
jgi:hypothetical protein